MIALPSCCCCQTTVPAKANNTTFTDCDSSTQSPYTRKDTDTPCHEGEPCRGAWPERSIVNSFTPGSPATAQIDRCIYGIKNAVAKLYWRGRYDFTSDYIANPKISTHMTEYGVRASLSESYTGKIGQYDSSGVLYCTQSGSGGNSLIASSKNTLTAGGLPQCAGTLNYSDGNGNWTDCSTPAVTYDYFQNNSSIGSTPFCVLPQTGYPELIAAGLNDGFVNANKNKIKNCCALDSDRGVAGWKGLCRIWRKLRGCEVFFLR